MGVDFASKMLAFCLYMLIVQLWIYEWTRCLNGIIVEAVILGLVTPKQEEATGCCGQKASTYLLSE